MFPVPDDDDDTTMLSANTTQVPRGEGAEATVVALPRQVPHVVPAALGAASYHRRVRAGRVCLL